MNHQLKPILGIAAILSGSLSLFAVPAIPEPVKVIQPDGTEILLRAYGDEEGFTLRTASDNQPVKLNKAGYYERAAIPSMIRTPRRNAAGLHHRKISINESGRYLRVSDYPTLGCQKALVVLVEFEDCPFTTMEDPYEYYDGLLNTRGFTHENGAEGSVRDYYNYSSAGLFDPDFKVVGPVRLSKPYAYYGADTETTLDPKAWEMVVEACHAIDEEVDFADFDADGDGAVDSIYFFYAGFGQADSLKGDAIWPHNGLLKDNWNVDLELDGKRINNYACSNEIRFNTAPKWMPVGIGTFVHEFGHVLGLADHYDTRYSSGRTGVEAWDTMAAASYNNDQNTPPAFSAYERAVLGWLDLDVTSPAAPGILSLNDLTDNAPAALRVDVPGTDGKEFFVIERRGSDSWDSTLPAHGILVWHIHEDAALWGANNVNTDPVTQHVDLIEADGTENATSYRGDVFPGSRNVTTFDFLSHAGDHIFCFDYLEPEDDATAILLGNTDFLPSTPEVEIIEIHGSQFTFTWQPSSDALKYEISVKDASGNPLPNYDKLQYRDVEMVEITDLMPESDYTVEIRGVAGSYVSEPGACRVSTGEIEFFENRPVDVRAAISADGMVEASWRAMKDASDYEVTLLKHTLGKMETEGYDFTDGIYGLPEGWSTTATKISKSIFGEKSPALQMSEDSDQLTIRFQEAQIHELTFYHRSQTDNNRLSVIAYASDGTQNGQYDVPSSSTGETARLALPDGTSTVSIEFRRTAGYLIIDDVVAEISRMIATPMEPYSNVSTNGLPGIVFTGVPAGEDYYLTVRGISHGVRSLDSEPVKVTERAAIGTIIADETDAADEIYDLCGRRLPDGILPERGTYILRRGGSSRLVIR